MDDYEIGEIVTEEAVYDNEPVIDDGQSTFVIDANQPEIKTEPLDEIQEIEITGGLEIFGRWKYSENFWASNCPNISNPLYRFL